MSVLALGTANNLARNLGFSAPLEEIIAGLRDAKKRPFDVGVARGPWGKRYFFESVGGGLLGEYLPRANETLKKRKNLSKEQEMARQVAHLRRMLCTYPARKWKITLDGEDISERYILWEAMNIRSVGPVLYLASQAATRDGRLDFVCAREHERNLLIEYLDARLAGIRAKFPLPFRKFRELTVVWKNSTLHFDGKVWPRKKKKVKSAGEIEITVKPSGLLILQPERH